MPYFTPPSHGTDTIVRCATRSDQKSPNSGQSAPVGFENPGQAVRRNLVRRLGLHVVCRGKANTVKIIGPRGRGPRRGKVAFNGTVDPERATDGNDNLGPSSLIKLFVVIPASSLTQISLIYLSTETRVCALSTSVCGVARPTVTALLNVSRQSEGYKTRPWHHYYFHSVAKSRRGIFYQSKWTDNVLSTTPSWTGSQMRVGPDCRRKTLGIRGARAILHKACLDTTVVPFHKYSAGCSGGLHFMCCA
ncbi:hypothetical protein IF1G_03800 [Cordyceps javanica]|uniref:Uncharacterized protein n=1 Tax=Cordyceps javanica TaxID=43265 RepID=A0A545V8K0_9HYPO|nr:hypothetical protein IF1G_03800 [Cordyceps javanica]